MTLLSMKRQRRIRKYSKGSARRRPIANMCLPSSDRRNPLLRMRIFEPLKPCYGTNSAERFRL